MISENQEIEATREFRVRGPALESLADIRRQAKRLFAQMHVTDCDAGTSHITADNLHSAVSLLTLIKSTILGAGLGRPADPACCQGCSP